MKHTHTIYAQPHALHNCCISREDEEDAKRRTCSFDEDQLPQIGRQAKKAACALEVLCAGRVVCLACLNPPPSSFALGLSWVLMSQGPPANPVMFYTGSQTSENFFEGDNVAKKKVPLYFFFNLWKTLRGVADL